MRTEPRPCLRYGCAFAAVALAVAVRLFLDPILGNQVPYATFFLAVLFAAWYGGAGPACVAVVAGGMAGNFLFTEPRHAFGIGGVDHLVATLLFVTTGFGIAALGGQMHLGRRKALTAAQAVTEQIQLAVNSARLGLWSWDVARNSVTILQPGGAACGIAENHPIASRENFLAMVHPDDRAHVNECIEKSLTGCAPYHVEYRILHPDGSIRWAVTDAHIRVDNNGRPLEMMGVDMDITERKLAELQLLSSEERLQLFVEHAPAAIAMLDNDMRYLVASRRWLSDFHLKKEEAIGRCHYDIFPDCPEKWRAANRECLKGSVQGGRDDPFQRLDGSTQWLTWEAHPWYDAAGAIGGLIFFVEDVTVRKDIEESLRRSERQFHRLLDSTAEAIYGVDLQGNCTFCNPSCLRMLGYASTADLLGKNMHALIHHTRADGKPFPVDECRVYEGFLSGTGTHADDEVLWRADRTSFPAEYWSYPIRENGQVTGAVVTFLDITDRIRLEAQLCQAQKMECVGQFAGEIAHDFNNLLTVINGHSQLMIDRLKPDDKIRKGLELVYRTGERAAALTRQLLTFSRHQVLDNKILSLNSVSADLQPMLRRLIPEDIGLNSMLAKDLWSIKADPGRLEQVIMNLCLNARDAMTSGGTITIETDNVELTPEYCRTHADARPGEYVRLAISDTGSGMSPEVKARIFEPFFTTKEVGRGTGLGLATVYGITKQSHGTIEVYSELGIGTTFKVYFPRATELDLERKLISNESVPMAPGHEMILLVEDDENVRELAREMLETFGYTVLVACNGREALDVFEKQRSKIALLISDVVMPEMGGAALTQRLKVLNPRLRVLFTSGYTNGAVISNGSLEPGVLFLQKPFSPAALAEKVRQALEDKPLAAVAAAS